MVFWRKTQKSASQGPDSEGATGSSGNTIIGKGWQLKGRVYGKGQVLFQSPFEGELDIQGRLTIDPEVNLKGTFHAEEVYVGGSLEGHLECSRVVVLESSARVEGDVITPRLKMEMGACLNGDIDMNSH